jgi:hypothetical protein
MWNLSCLVEIAEMLFEMTLLKFDVIFFEHFLIISLLVSIIYDDDKTF